ncbi:MAG: ribonuclease H-like domain-containing protein [Clostridia bacterium]
MIINKTSVKAEQIDANNCLEIQGDKDIYKNALYLDLEHFIYKVPLCVGVFGICYFNDADNTVETVQYMIQDKQDAKEILYIIRDFFAANDNKYIVTFAGENDFSVINYLFKKHKIKLDFEKNFFLVDLQKKYLKQTGNTTGLKNLEKVFGISRGGELISGSNLAKTFGRILKEPGYGQRISKEKVDKILNYNLEDVINLFYITTRWNRYIMPT